MDLSTAQNIWSNISQAAARVNTDARDLANSIADSFMADYAGRRPLQLSKIELLCRMATSDDAQLSKAAVAALYGTIIEGLSDDFTVAGVNLCNRVLIEIISFLRQNSLTADLDSMLTELGYDDSLLLLERYRRILRNQKLSRPHQTIKKALILSRVTIGADVAITSVIAWRLRRALPEAELVLIGPNHLRQIFHHLPGSRVIVFPSKRRGNLVERFSFWPELYRKIMSESKGFSADEILLFDPESRLSQLGLMPLYHEHSTFLFKSRSLSPKGANHSLSALANQWLNEILSEQSFCFPRVSFSNQQVEVCRRFCDRLRENGCKRVVAINLGVGEDSRKRINDPFEELIVISLLKKPDTILLLDSGCGSEEKSRVDKLIRNHIINKSPHAWVQEKDFAAAPINFSHGIIALENSVGGFGALLNEADFYLGYDSCFQHLANASTTPAIIVFAGHPNERFIARWTPENISASTKIIAVADNRSLSEEKIIKLAAKVTQALDDSIT